MGEIAAERMLTNISSGASVDPYLADQLITYMGLAGGGTFTTYELSKHTLTNIYITELLLGVEFKIKEKEKLTEIVKKSA